MQQDFTPGKRQSVLIICMNYFNEEDTVAYVRSLFTQNYSSALRVLIVDNSTIEPPNTKLQSLQKESTQIRVLYPKKNLGYLGGAAWGLEVFLANQDLPDWVIVSNTDIEFLNKNFFQRLFDFYPNGFNGVVAPSILSGLTGCNQNPFMENRPTKYRMHFLKWIFMTYPTLVFYQFLAIIKSFIKKNRAMKRNDIIQQPITIYAPHGSFILFNKNFFLQGGNLDYEVFLFGEEIFIAETVKKQNLKIQFDPRLVVLHNEHATTGMIKNKKMARFMKEASAYCANRYFKD